MRPLEGSFKNIDEIVLYLYAVGVGPIFREKVIKEEKEMLVIRAKSFSQ